MQNKLEQSRRRRNRSWIYASVLVGFLAFFLVCKVAYDLHRLSIYRSFIETQYAPQIAVIEQNCRDYPKSDLSEEGWQKQQQTVKDIRKSLSGGEIYCAYWSLDGHHSSEALKPMETGFSTYHFKILGSHDVDGLHSLYYGKTFDNQNLLIYEGWVTSGGKRQYELAFLLDEIKKAVSNGQPDRPSVSAQ